MELWQKLLISGLFVMLFVLIVVQEYVINKYRNIVDRYEKLFEEK